MKTKKETFYIKDFAVTIRSELYDDELMDTQVFIGEEYICTIAGVYIGDFVSDLRKLIESYSI